MENKPVDAEIVNDSALEVVQMSIVPAKKTGDKIILFNEENKDQLIQVFVNSETVHFDKSADECKKLVKKYAKLTVKDKDDKDGYEKVKAAWSELQKIRTSTEKKRKELGSPYAAIQSGINTYAKDSIVDVLNPTEVALKAEKDKYEKWEVEEKARKEKEFNELKDKRITELKEAGLAFDGELYSIGEHISMDANSIGKMKDDAYSTFLLKVQFEKKKIDDAAAAALAKEEKEKAEQKAEKERLEQQAKDLRNEKIEAREDKLVEAGLVQDAEKEMFHYESSVIFIKNDYDSIAAMDKATFAEFLKGVKESIEKDKQRIKDSEAEVAPADTVDPAAEVAEVPAKDITPAAEPIDSGFDRNAPDGGRGYSGFRSLPPTSKTDSKIQDVNNIKDYLNVVNFAELPKISDTNAAEIFSEYRAAVKAAEVLLLEKLGA